jgi:hypothetical protein
LVAGAELKVLDFRELPSDFTAQSLPILDWTIISAPL